MVDDFDNWVKKFVAYYTALQIVAEWLKATEPKKRKSSKRKRRRRSKH